MMILVLGGLIVLATPPDQTGWEVPADAVGEATASAGTSAQFDGVAASLVVGPLATEIVSSPDAAGSLAAGPLPFDPLSPEEQRRAVRLALADDSAFAERHQVIGAALYTDKAFLELDAWPRMAEVWIYDYAKDANVQVLVDLSLGAVVSRVFLDVDPPLAAAELRRAGKLALADALTVERLDAQGIDSDGLRWTARLWSGPACGEHRCALVALQDGSRFLFDPLVVVDLSARQVVGLLDAQGRLANGPVDA